MAFAPTNSMILVIINPILGYVRPSEADIEDCGMRKRAWPLAQIAQHEKKQKFFSELSVRALQLSSYRTVNI